MSTLTRRDALVSLASMVPAVALANSLGAADPKPLWKPAIGLNGFLSSAGKYKKSYPLWEILDYASRTGFAGVELVQLWPSPGDYYASSDTTRVRALRRLYDGFGLQIFSIQLPTAEAFSPDPEIRKQWLATFRDRIQLAKALGCACVGMWPGGALGNQTFDQALSHLAASYGEAAKIAADAGIIAAFEIEPPFIFNKEEHMQRILAEAQPSPLKIIYDPSHFDLMNGSTGKPHEMLARIGVQNLGYVQFTDSDGTLRDGGTSKHLPCGDGHVDIPASLKLIRDGNFRGWIMIDAWETPDPYDASTKGLKAIAAASK